MVRPVGQHAVAGDEILHGRDLGREDDAVPREAHLLGAVGGEDRRLHQRLARHGARLDRRGRAGVQVHEMREQFLVERAPVGADAHALAVLRGELDDGAELAVLLLAEADIAGIDAVLVQRLGARRMIGEQLVADVVEVAHERYVHATQHQPVADMGDGGGRLVAVHK